MEFGLIIVVVGFLFIAHYLTKQAEAHRDGKTVANGHSAQITIQVKACPPHQWFWQEVIDQHGNSQGERIVCKVCGPIAGQSGRD